VSKITILIVALLAVSAISFAFAAPTASANGPTRRLGFWLQESNSFPPPQAFFNAMFLSPPYPSSLEVMIFAPMQDQINNFSPGAANSFTAKSINFWGTVAQLADSYPNIRLIFDIAFDPYSSVYGLASYQMIVNSLAKHPSVYGLGVEGEYTPETLSMMTTAMSYSAAFGKQFVNYYADSGALPSGAYQIVHTNFPGGDSGGYDQVETLQTSDAGSVGIDSGYYGNFAFPASINCPIGQSSITSSTAGWNQCVVRTELGTAVSLPQQLRQFLELDVGFSSSGSFTGVSGLTTNQLWDNPTLRNWIWTDPNYQGNFILSTGAAASVTTTSVISSTSTTQVIASTSTSTMTTIASGQPAFYRLATHVACPSGIQSCGNASPVGVRTYSDGSTVTLTAYPYGGYVFSSWSICTNTCQTYTNNPLPFELSGDTQATANFVEG
jgi:hypothetical protein